MLRRIASSIQLSFHRDVISTSSHLLPKRFASTSHLPKQIKSSNNSSTASGIKKMSSPSDQFNPLLFCILGGSALALLYWLCISKKRPVLRKELIIEVPVETQVMSEFTQNACHSWEVQDTNRRLASEKMVAFIKQRLEEAGIKNVDLDYICELADNSFDAYAAAGLKIGNRLILKVVVSDYGRDVVVKIKDNGPGFTNKPKGKFFDCKRQENSYQFAYKTKERGYIGGYKRGLYCFIETMKRSSGEVKFKNRKDKGCSAYVTFKKR